MKKNTILWLFVICYLLMSCSPIKTPVSNQYTLSSFSNKQLAGKYSKKSILITAPESSAGYQTEEMVYVKKPFELSSFANNAWVDPPADMLFPLIMQSLQRSGYFYAVSSGPNSDLTDYRLDTQLIELKQSFLKKPSSVQLVVKAVLSHVKTNRIIASNVISLNVNCPMESPYGGVIAANKAVENFTAELAQFIVNHVKRDTEE